jgi:hypothetical protein
MAGNGLKWGVDYTQDIIKGYKRMFMKLLKCIIVLMVILIVCSGCVSRTIRSETGSGAKGTITERRIIWIWEKEYRND